MSGELLIFRRNAVSDMYVLMVDGEMFKADMTLIKWSKGGGSVTGND